MDTLAIRRLRVLPVPRGAGLSPKHKLGILAELSGLGYAVANPERLDGADPSLLSGYGQAIATLAAMRGGDVDYVPLFLGFPTEVPDDDEYFARRLVGYVGNLLGLFEHGERLDNGVVVPSWLLDLRQFGADPITQLQTESQWKAARDALAERVPDGHAEWIELELCWADEVPARLQAWLRDCLYARSSIKEELHADLRTLLARYGTEAGIDCERIMIHETKALMLQALWEAGRLDAVRALASGPTDLLRMLAAITGSDVSLASKMRFPKLRRAQRRVVMEVIEGSARPTEDLARYRGLWLALGRYVHPGEHGERFPRAAEAFDRLRNGTIRTFEGRTEQLLAARDLAGVLEHLRARPGLLARRLHELLRRFPGGQDSQAIAQAFAEVAPSMTTKALLVLRKHLASIDDAEHRTVINKRGKIKVLPNNARHGMMEAARRRVDEVIHGSLLQQLGTRETWQGRTVWIDPALCDYTVPLQQRAASDGLLTFGRGSRIPVAMDKVLRLFVYWKQTSKRTDLDLSLIQLDEGFTYQGHVSYTRLSDTGIVHSGDIQSAPHGAAEFIDVTLSALPSNVRYLAVQVYRFAGEAFTEMQCHAGWMVRDRVDARVATFDIATVANKFDLNGTGAYCVPLLVDLVDQRIVLVDLYMGQRAFHNNVEGALGNVTAACREIGRFCQTRPTMHELAELHVQGRGGTRVEAREFAEITFGVSGCTYDASDVETVLAELL